MNTLAARVRLGLMGSAAILLVLVTMQPSHSQGISGRPPIGIGGGSGISGRPGGISGISGRPGGFSGIGGIPEPPGAGIRGIPEPPGLSIRGIPEPPGLGIRGIPEPPGLGIGGGIGGIPTGPRFVTVWSCSRCGNELGRGDFPPAVNTCPRCNARLVGGGIGSAPVQMPPIGMPNNPTPAPAAGIMGGLPMGIVPPNDFNNHPNPVVTPPVTTNPGSPTLTVTPPVTESKSGSRVYTIIGVTLGLLLLIGIGVTILVMAWPKSEKPQRRRSRSSSRSRYRDEDDY